MHSNVSDEKMYKWFYNDNNNENELNVSNFNWPKQASSKGSIERVDEMRTIE